MIGFKGLDEEKDPDKGKKVKHRGPLGKVIELVIDYPNPAELNQKLHDTMRKDFKKGDFAASLFERFDSGNIACPNYINEALDWLAKQLKAGGRSGVIAAEDDVGNDRDAHIVEENLPLRHRYPAAVAFFFSQAPVQARRARSSRFFAASLV